MSKEQTALERIKDEVAKEAYCLDWNHLVHKYPSSKDTKYWPIVIERYARECCQATLEDYKEKLKAALKEQRFSTEETDQSYIEGYQDSESQFKRLIDSIKA